MAVRPRLDLEEFDGVGAVWFEQSGGIVGGQFDVAFGDASVVELALGALYEFDDEVSGDFDLLELGDLLGVAEALSHCFEPGGQLEDPHVDEEVVGEADLDSGFAERHRVRSPLVVLADVGVGVIKEVALGGKTASLQCLAVLTRAHLFGAR